MKPLDDSLKQRVVGALVLVALGVIFVPVLFDREPLNPVDRESQIPKPPEVVTIEIESPKIPDAIEVAPEPSQMYVPDETKALPSAPEPPGLAEDGTPKSWVLQVASVRDKHQAMQLQKKLIDLGHSAFVREVTYKNGTINRVYVGPKLEKQSLLRAKESIDTSVGVKSLLLPFTP